MTEGANVRNGSKADAVGTGGMSIASAQFRLQDCRVSLFAALLLIAGAAPSNAVPRDMPDTVDAVDAYFEWEVAMCRALIDVCEAPVLPLGKEAISDLSCRPTQAGRARCSFRTLGSICTAYFVSEARPLDHARSVRRSSLDPDADNHWAVSWAEKVGLSPEVKCD